MMNRIVHKKYLVQEVFLLQWILKTEIVLSINAEKELRSDFSVLVHVKIKTYI